MPTSGPLVQLNVLVVDDDDADAFMIEEALIDSAVPTVLGRVPDGQEALAYLRRTGQYADAVRPDLILLDLNMPRKGGLQTLTEIKADATLEAIPVVVLTTSDAPPDIIASYEHHASAFVTKPMDLESFETAVRKISTFYGEIARLPRTS
ncbi:response regulator [Actinoplanes derwentensis]|uniref:Response regulator receiver domain-containing protein n=1 Tax=Actinoplanes derwentensis TaxID=113562 RepID=A0A1H1VLW0_9ACTN|nr:response regulator [Actinoplanes derwentensis]GID83657.1 two-component system response regulator [Actinoplanes derwentensis]SDS85772.1 Response regulator receiver domain-containing protein [Actinoplanes derwentensis]